VKSWELRKWLGKSHVIPMIVNSGFNKFRVWVTAWARIRIRVRVGVRALNRIRVRAIVGVT
jgi:hypothetical protein